MITTPQSVGVYVHLPWCIHKCPYCDFNSHEASQEKVRSIEEEYVDTLIEEFNFYQDLIKERIITSIFFGGGTPSLISPKLFEKFINAIHKNFNLSQTEITLEANPGTIDIKYFQSYADLGINRVSLGIQSFNDTHLQSLERIHSSSEAKQAIDIVKKYFRNFNLDLMFGLPNQSLAELKEDINTAISFDPNHLSFYHLTIEPQTRFFKSKPEIPSDDDAYEMLSLVLKELKNSRFDHYETSAFAQPGDQCRHNLNYWTFGDYLGIGAGAHSKLTHENEIFRMDNTKNPKHYIIEVAKQNFFSNKTSIPQQDLPFEFLMNALRLTHGFNKKTYSERTGLSFDGIKSKLHPSFQQDLLYEDHEILKPTAKGVLFLNEILHNLI
jgi:putative oxygen-independent coproporphyrinogen III oxidase